MIASIVVFLILSAALGACFVYLQHRIDEHDAAVTDMRTKVANAVKSVTNVVASLNDLTALVKTQPSKASAAPSGKEKFTDPPPRGAFDDHKTFFESLARRVDGVEMRMLPFERSAEAAREREGALQSRIAKLEAQIKMMSVRSEAADVVATRSLRVRGGISDGDREGKLPTEFASDQDGRNHIRGDTEVMGDLMLLGGHSRFCVGGRCYDARQLRNALDNALADACDASWSTMSATS